MAKSLSLSKPLRFKLMILTELKTYLANTKVANLFDLSKRFDLNPEIVKDMLGVWINKGKVRKVPKCTGCAVKCVSCNPLLTEIYEWVGG